MEFKGTKGKWDYSEETIIVFSVDKNGEADKAICSILPYGKMNEITRSNAKLIAAAPELLEALIECKRVLAEYDSDKSINAHYKAEQAINKALNQ